MFLRLCSRLESLQVTFFRTHTQIHTYIHHSGRSYEAQSVSQEKSKLMNWSCYFISLEILTITVECVFPASKKVRCCVRRCILPAGICAKGEVVEAPGKICFFPQRLFFNFISLQRRRTESYLDTNRRTGRALEARSPELFVGDMPLSDWKDFRYPFVFPTPPPTFLPILLFVWLLLGYAREWVTLFHLERSRRRSTGSRGQNQLLLPRVFQELSSKRK